MSATGPNHFLKVTGVQFDTGGDALPIYSVAGIGLRNSKSQIISTEPNNTYPVAVHTLMHHKQVTFSFEDINALIQLETLAEDPQPTPLIFIWLASAMQYTGGPLPNQLVTINNVVISSIETTAADRALGRGIFVGNILGMTDGSNPIVYEVNS